DADHRAIVVSTDARLRRDPARWADVGDVRALDLAAGAGGAPHLGTGGAARVPPRDARAAAALGARHSLRPRRVAVAGDRALARVGGDRAAGARARPDRVARARRARPARARRRA